MMCHYCGHSQPAPDTCPDCGGAMKHIGFGTQKVEAILGEQTVTGVQLADGAVREVSGVFVALGVAGSTALARKLGAAVEGSRIVVDDKMQTTVPGLYAAGDCTGGLLQVAKAVYEGALAGTEAAKALRKG